MVSLPSLLPVLLFSQLQFERHGHLNNSLRGITLLGSFSLPYSFVKIYNCPDCHHAALPLHIGLR
jgi:hypothetical protein